MACSRPDRHPAGSSGARDSALLGAAGLLAQRFGLDALGPFLIVTAIGLGVLYAIGAGARPGEMRGRAEAPVRT
jgi:hypothetical protein